MFFHVSQAEAELETGHNTHTKDRDREGAGVLVALRVGRSVRYVSFADEKRQRGLHCWRHGQRDFMEAAVVLS